ncbi:MAG: peptide chain release factor N(5)-glutamine methyltransferase [bacterium]
MTETWTILKLLQWTAEYFQSRGIESARLDAELILAHALGLSRIQLYTQFDRPLNSEELQKVKGLVKRRAQREPLAYLLGSKEFYSLEFKVSPAVLIPRPETELLVEEGIRLLQNPTIPPFSKGGQGGFEILDIGTGSGCIAVALAKHLAEAQTWAVDASQAALEIAAENARKHGVEGRIHFLAWDVLNGDWKGPAEPFDLIVTNPPYVSSTILPRLAPELQFEPKMALEAGPKGLDLYPAILGFAFSHLKPGGWLLAEMGEEQGGDLLEISRQKGFASVDILKDLAGKPRVLRAKRPFDSPIDF